MAKKRMFSLQIVDTDAFLEMPLSTQALYFHLVMRADDEGFIDNPKRIMRLIGCQDDEMKVLIAKRFILIFESGVIVIKHWLIHNTIRMDRFNQTVYTDEKSLLSIKENKAYTDNGNQLVTKWQPNGNQMETQVKLSKVKLSKDNIISQQVGEPDTKKINEVNYLIGLFEKVNPSFKRLYANKTQRAALTRMIKEHGEERLQEIIEKLPDIVTKPYAPKITTPVQLERDFGKLIIFIKQNQTSNNLKRGGVYVIEE